MKKHVKIITILYSLGVVLVETGILLHFYNDIPAMLVLSGLVLCAAVFMAFICSLGIN